MGILIQGLVSLRFLFQLYDLFSHQGQWDLSTKRLGANHRQGIVNVTMIDLINLWPTSQTMQSNSQPEEPPQPSTINVANVLGTIIAALTLVAPLYVTAYYSAKSTPFVPWFQNVDPNQRR